MEVSQSRKKTDKVPGNHSSMVGRGDVQSHISTYSLVSLSMGESTVTPMVHVCTQNWRLNARCRLLRMLWELDAEGSVLQAWMMNIQQEPTPEACLLFLHGAATMIV